MNMHAGRLFKVTSLVGLVLAVAVAGCSSSSEGGSGGSGSGGSGSGGSGPGSGGSGSGGSGSGGSSSGGTTGSGGASSGGSSGSGGAASGGSNGSGGASSGGSVGSGGASSGGSSGSGGGTASGGNGGGQAGGGRSGSGSGGASTGGAGGGSPPSMCAGGTNNIPPTGGMTLTSPDHAECAKFDVKFTCACGMMNPGITCSGSVGANGNNPELDWGNVPDGTKSFVLTFLDTTQLDMGASHTAMGEHWAMWNIPAAARKLPQLSNGNLMGDLMGAKETAKFFEPCPSATDKYEFALYALSTDTLTVSGMSVANVRAALKMVTPLAVATLHGTTGAGGK